MKNILKFHTLIIVFISVLYGCGGIENRDNNKNGNEECNVKYAQGFDIKHLDDYTKIEIYDSRSKSVSQKLYLVKSEEVKVPDDGLKIVVPIKSIAVSSVTYYPFIEVLGEMPTIKGVSLPNLAYNQYVVNKYSEGKIIDIGDATNLNFERLVYINPDVFMLPSYNNQKQTLHRLYESGVKTVINNEWLEVTPLGRTEWIKLFGALYDKVSMADSIFDSIESRYIEAKRIVESVKKKRSVFFNANFKGTWYMPGGRSYVTQLVRDANGEYVYDKDKSLGGLPLSFETVLSKCSDADVWLNAPAKSMNELLEMDNRHRLFKAFKSKNVYGFNKRCVEDRGANDYWEKAVIEPDVVLKDIIWALYPEVMPEYESVYVKKLE